MDFVYAFNALQQLSRPRNLEGEVISSLVREANNRASNVELLQNIIPENLSD